MKYIAINIGPIVKTLDMARKPRELWAASYLFSYLMKCIAEAIPKDNILSPEMVGDDAPKEVGLYPDRVFAKDINTKDVIGKAKKQFFERLKVNNKIWDYFNIMYVDYVPEKDNENESVAIKELNNRLNILELCNYTTDAESIKVTRELLDVEKSVLLHNFFDDKNYSSLGEIAAVELEKEQEFVSFKDAVRSKDSKVANDAYKIFPKDKLKSYHKYICVVQADGDNVGKTVSHSQLGNGKVKEISSALLEFGKSATEKIKTYGGFPIYAGGDDLLFVAPVVGKTNKDESINIFALIDDINKSFEPVKNIVTDYRTSNGEPLRDDKGKQIVPAMSFGVSITYFKHPLYEALRSARLLLEETAKDKYDTGNLRGKNAIALKLQKHSGSGFDIAFSKIQCEDNPLWGLLLELIDKTSDGNTVSAVAHKIRNNYGLAKMVLSSRSNERLNAMFDTILECTGTPYFTAVKNIMPVVYDGIQNHTIYVEPLNNESEIEYENSKYGNALYNILRIAKFIKGEEAKDE